MTDIPEVIWSNTDYPYICLIDKKRTEAFRAAIKATVLPGNTVVEVGAGTGILSLFAAAAGAQRVIAVEIDPILARSLRQTVHDNDFEHIIEVVEGDATVVDLPQDADVVIGELVETGLIDEMQVAVMNKLREKGVIGTHTRLVPEAYETFCQLVYTDSTFYGYKIDAPKHDWPYYAKDKEEWTQLELEAVTDQQKLSHVDFCEGRIDPVVDKVVEFKIEPGKQATALRLSGIAHMTTDQRLGACNSFNGDKILSLPDKSYEGTVKLRFSYKMSEGMNSFHVSVAR
ncbi:MAG TPA: 50S ribosomal protein L11 methyltransferase [Candidatus Saccharimonadales bacterium]|nr:50S ribosomal protein L11 methyltransferase [Candidatus Saccharimonadales bacterium]